MCFNLHGHREKPYSSENFFMDVSFFPISKREHPSTNEAKTAKSFEETRSGHIDFRIQGLSHSTVQQEDDVRRETVKKLIHQFETHPNRESLMEENKNQKFNLFSEKSKELIRSMGNTEYFEMCEITSKVQCPDCSRYWETCIENCTCGKCLQPSERNRHLNKERYDVLSIANYVIKKNPSHGARHGPTERQRIYYNAHDMLRKARKKRHNTTLERFQNYPLYRDSLTNIGWDENTCIAYDEIAKEDHSYVGTRGERSRTRTRGDLNAEGANGPLGQRTD